MFWQITLDLLEGFGNTCLLFFLTLVLALPLGLLVAFGAMSKIKILRAIVKIFIWIIRGTPRMLQVLVIFYVPGLLFHYQLFGAVDKYLLLNYGIEDAGRILAVLIAFAINYACYFSEIYRGGIESISVGQYEAGQVLGMTRSQVFFKVVLLQVVKRIVPPMSNEIITLIKDTALACLEGVLKDGDIVLACMESDCLLVEISSGFYARAQILNSEDERLILYAMVNALCDNLNVCAVRVNVEGRDAETFAGGIRLDGKLYPNYGLMAE